MRTRPRSDMLRVVGWIGSLMASRWPRAIESWITPSAAANDLRVSPDTVVRYADQGRLRAVRTAYGRLLDPASVAAFKATQTKATS